MKLHVETTGEGPRVVLVHGGMGYPSWRNQMVLSERFQLEKVIRPGYPPNPPKSYIGFEIDAKLIAEYLETGAHLVGHSYGGLICLLAASLRPEAVFSLTVTEPPCFAVARGNAHVDEFVSAGIQLHEMGLQDSRQFMKRFMEIMGLPSQLPDPLPAEMQQLVHALMVERPPWEAQIPLAKLRNTSFPILIVSGAVSHPAQIEVCDVLEKELDARRVILPDTDHRIMHSPDFNDVLEAFLTQSEVGI